MPGKPDIVLPRHRTVVFVHGCFWHRHPGCPQASTPATRQEYWLPKFRRTVARDKRNRKELASLGWRVILVWECELRRPEQVAAKLAALLGPQAVYAGGLALPKAAEAEAPYGAPPCAERKD